MSPPLRIADRFDRYVSGPRHPRIILQLRHPFRRGDQISVAEVVGTGPMATAAAELLTDEPNLVRAAKKIMEMGPRVVVVKFGEYGANMYTADGVFGLRVNHSLNLHVTSLRSTP